LQLALASFNRFPDLAGDLLATTGMDIEFQWSGLVDVITDKAQYRAIETALGWRREMGLAFELMDNAQVHNFEPALSTYVAGGLFFPKEGDVNPMSLNNAYALGAQRLGSAIKTATEVTGLGFRGGRVRGLYTSRGPVAADIVVNAAGAWSPAIGNMVGLSVPVRPVRGQIMVTEALPNLISHCLIGAHTYLVPKAKGNIVIGATQEEVGYHKAMTITGLSSLASDAVAMVPLLRNVAIIRSWCGLRPGSIDDWPFLGPVSGLDGFILATGHFRNGCLLSPITGQLIAEHIVDGRSSLSLKPFSIERHLS
jgi:glycine oxidase ThiO